MATYYAKRALEILREEGPVELSKTAKKFILGGLCSHYYRRLFKFNTWKNHLKNRIRYDAPPDPYQPIEIRANKIEYQAGKKKGPRRIKKGGGLAQTIAGAWDRPQHRQNVEENIKIKGVIQRFEQGKDWQETELHNYYTNKGVDSTQIKEWYNNVEYLFNDIYENGYITGHEGSHHRGYSQSVRDRLEVLVTVDRDGEVCHLEGNHRFAIARVLGIQIPVQVVCRHKQWQELRDEIHNNGLPEGREDLQDHPDLQDILD